MHCESKNMRLVLFEIYCSGMCSSIVISSFTMISEPSARLDFSECSLEIASSKLEIKSAGLSYLMLIVSHLTRAVH